MASKSRRQKTLTAGFGCSKAQLFVVLLFLGAGQGLVTNTSIIVVTLYFKRKLGMVMGILFTVMALGGIVAPLLLALSLSKYSLRTVILSYGIWIMVGIVGAIFFTEDAKGTETQAKLQLGF